MKMTIKEWYMIYSVMKKEKEAAYTKLCEYRETYGKEKRLGDWQFDLPLHEQRYRDMQERYDLLVNCVSNLEYNDL